MTQFLSQLSDLAWGAPTMVLFLAVGICMTIVTKGVQFRKLGRSIRQVGGSLRKPADGVSSFQAVCTALAATVGTGNIAGVAGAIALGGPGAVFWMWVSAFLGMATKYAEVVLSMRYRTGDRGGPMYYMARGLKKPWMAMAFAWCALLASFGMGNIAQIHTIASSVLTAAQRYAPVWKPEAVALFTGMTAAVLVALVTVGGARRVGKTMEKLVPFVSVCYIFGALWIVVSHFDRIPTAFSTIIRHAFTPRAAMGEALRWGISRGVFSNEAGLGSAPMAHAAANAKPEEQGLFGIFEVFLDTIVLCTLTALAILVSGISVPYGKPAGAELAVSAMETVFGPSSAGILAICLSLLALATLMSWQLYGLQCAGYLFGSRGEAVYRLVYVAVIVLGATMDLSAAWALSDLFNALMALPNLAALWCLRKEISQ